MRARAATFSGIFERTLSALTPACIPQPDSTYRRLLGEDAWARLAPEIRQRFSIKPAPLLPIFYAGLVEVRLSRVGRALAQLARLVGGPLPWRSGSQVPVAVTLRNDGDGVHWQRDYAYTGGRIGIGSSKRLAPNGTLEEYLGLGLSMALAVSEYNGELHFVSRGYFLALGRRRWRLPDWLTPGQTHVVHQQIAGNRFCFRLKLCHPRYGELLYQAGEFTSAGPARRD